MESKPLDARERKDEELVDHGIGFEAGLEGELYDTKHSPAWRRGWQASQT